MLFFRASINIKPLFNSMLACNIYKIYYLYICSFEKKFINYLSARKCTLVQTRLDVLVSLNIEAS